MKGRGEIGRERGGSVGVKKIMLKIYEKEKTTAFYFYNKCTKQHLPVRKE